MERSEIYEKLNEIFRDVLDNDEIELQDSTCADDIEEWDSLGQIQLTVAVEKAFNVKFQASEMASWKNVGEMVDCLMAK